MKSAAGIILLVFLLVTGNLSGQNETSQWYFGNKAGLDFMTSPPTILTNGMMNTAEGCSSISNSSGALLFYTDGITVWDQNHAVMANGTSLSGSPSTSQSGVIVKKPGSANIYYVFTLTSTFGDLFYSEVDMTLAAGAGSVTVKNNPVDTTLTEHLTSVRHCNGIDTWVLAHRANSSNDFLAFLVTSAGVNTVAVVSTVGSGIGTFYLGCMKFSPNGTKLGFALAGNNLVELFDFNASTGVVSNPLPVNGPLTYPYGVEFSPDGTKFYAKGHNFVAQWDLCAGSNSAIVASVTTFTTIIGVGSMQLAKDGKIYVARFNQNSLGVVNNPNAVGTGCNYVDVGQSIAPKISQAGLPNFITSWFKMPSVPFSYTLNCNTANFSSPVQPTLNAGCQSLTYSVTGRSWNFGDPVSGGANTSTLSNPSHAYYTNGTVTTQLILYYSCGGGTDTLKQVFTIANAAPNLSVTGNFTICAGDKRVYTAAGANTYSWNTGASTASISVSPTLTTTYTVTGTTTSNGCSAQKIFTVTVNKCTGIQSEKGIENNTVEIYPNPNNHYLFIENTTRVGILILNQQGQAVLKEDLEPGKNQLDIENFKDGIYFIRIITESGVTTKRLVKDSK